MKLSHILIILGFLVPFDILLYGQIDFPEIKGWSKSNPDAYNSETLWEYINGAADYYLSYGFVKLDVMEYQRTEEEYIKLEIYQHNSSLNTFGIYAYERPSETTFLNLGIEGYIEHSSINFYGKKWYVKIHTHQKDDGAIKAIKDIAGKVSELLGEETAPPKELTLFPKESIIEHSEKYYPANYLGMSFFNHALSAEYKDGDDKYTVFIISGESEDLTEKMLSNYFEFTKTQEDIVENKIYTVNDFFNGQVNILLKKNKLIGILDLDENKKAETIIRKINKTIESVG